MQLTIVDCGLTIARAAVALSLAALAPTIVHAQKYTAAPTAASASRWPNKVPNGPSSQQLAARSRG